MSFPATNASFGIVGIFGVTSPETGIIVDSIDFDTKSKEKSSMTVIGNTQGLVMFDCTCDISVKGQMKTGTAAGLALQKIATLLVLTNSILDGGAGTGSTGSIICKEVKVTTKVDDFQNIEISATYYPNILSS